MFHANKLIVALFVILPSLANAENVVECAEPPGGKISCPTELLAACRVHGGKIFGVCKEVFEEDLKNRKELLKSIFPSSKDWVNSLFEHDVSSIFSGSGASTRVNLPPVIKPRPYKHRDCGQFPCKPL